MEISKRINEIRESLFGGVNKDFARALNEKENTTSNWIKRGASLDVVDKIVDKLPNISKSWLLTGEGKMLRNSQDEEQPMDENNTFTDISNPVNQETMVMFNQMMTVISQQSSQIGSLISQHDRLISEVEKSGNRADRMMDLLESAKGASYHAPKKEAM